MPNWQKRGIGIYWRDVKKEGLNPKTNKTVLVDRRELYANLELPMREEYNQFIKTLMEKNEDPVII